MAYAATTLVLLVLMPVEQAAAQNTSAACNPASAPQFDPSFDSLRNKLAADVVGSPVGCAQTDTEGDVVQSTTTGLAIYHPTGVALFASGAQHWAVTSSGLQTWMANWHNGFEPPVTPLPQEADDHYAGRLPASVQAVTVVGSEPQHPERTIVEDAAGQRYALEPAAGCGELGAEQGAHVFLRSDGPRPGPESVLIRVDSHQSCPLTAVQDAPEALGPRTATPRASGGDSALPESSSV